MPPQMLLTPANFQQYLLSQIKIIPWLDGVFLKLLAKYMGIIFSNTLPFCSSATVPAMEKIVPWARYLCEFCLCVGMRALKWTTAGLFLYCCRLYAEQLQKGGMMQGPYCLFCLFQDIHRFYSKLCEKQHNNKLKTFCLHANRFQAFLKTIRNYFRKTNT